MTDNVRGDDTAATPDPMVEVPTEDSAAAPDDGHGHGGGRKGAALLGLAALGVVFGDIGTSPLYSLQTVFSMEHNTVAADEPDIFGVISLVFWAITLIVSLKYVTLVMRADNDGEGGILALVALLRDRLGNSTRLGVGAVMVGIVGAGLFYGDSVITPAISVMSAIEGVTIHDPVLEEFVLPIAVVILTGLFAIQRFGTAKVGRAFGPVMVIWFLVLALLGIPHILQTPRIIGALLPHHAIAFAVERPFVAFVAMGAVVLTITGAEALYADMGHFGAKPIRLAWFGLVFPALLLNYLGQGAMLLEHPDWVDNPFFRLAPDWATVPLVILATVATVIASQSVISGAFSVSRQASRLGLMPRLTVVHTSKSEGGQIYIGSINWALFVGVLLLISIFQTSARLATAYGLAVTGTLLLTTVLFLGLARRVWNWPMWAIIAVAVGIGGLEAMILTANLLKLFSGGWIPLVIAACVMLLMTTWRRGLILIRQRREKLAGSLADFVTRANDPANPVQRVPGLAVFPHPTKDTVPLALKHNLLFNNVLHSDVIIMNIVNENVPHIRHVDREHLDLLGNDDDGISYIDCHVGFNDSQDVPKALRLAIETFPELAHLKEEDARYFLSVSDIKREDNHLMPDWRKRIFQAMARNQADANAIYHTPKERTVMMGVELYL